MFSVKKNWPLSVFPLYSTNHNLTVPPALGIFHYFKRKTFHIHHTPNLSLLTVSFWKYSVLSLHSGLILCFSQFKVASHSMLAPNVAQPQFSTTPGTVLLSDPAQMAAFGAALCPLNGSPQTPKESVYRNATREW